MERPPGRGRGSGEGREVRKRLLGVLRDLSGELTERVSAWSEALRGTAHWLGPLPPHEGARPERACLTEEPVQGSSCPDILHSALLSVEGDLSAIDALLSHVRITLDDAIGTLCDEEATAMAEAKTAFQTNPLTRVTSQSQPRPLDSGCHENTHSASESHDAPGFESAQPRLGATLPEDGGEEVLHTHNASCSQGSDGRGVSDLNSSRPRAGLGGEGESEPREREEQTSTGAEGKGKIEGDVVRTVEPETDIHKDNPLEADEHREMEAEREKEMHREGKRARGGESQLVTSGLTGRSTNGQADVPNVCYITAPEGVAQVLTCEVVETLSSLMVIGSEELVSNVMRVKVQDGSQCQFPIAVAVPFRARYRGNYRDVVVKVIDGDGRVSSISPVSTEGTFGGQKGSFAQVRVYALGLFAVLSCLKRESYTVPGRGLSIKLSMDPRVCLDYLPGSFTAPVVVQSMLQPVDTPLLSSLKSSSEVYHSLVSTTPLLHLAHPTSQPLRRPLSLTLPCPPGADKRRAAGRGEEPERPISVAPPRETPGLRRARALSASAHCSRESSNELLVLLGWREEQWNVLEKTTVRNLQNGLVSFELTENYERLMVTRLFSSMRSSHLVSLVEEVEACVQRTMVTVVLQRRRDDPQAAVVAVFPSRDLGWELSKLRAQAYCGPPEPSQETPMCEGEQLLLSFTGNVTSTVVEQDRQVHGSGSDKNTTRKQIPFTCRQ
ncbi:death domain-containing protein 1 [Osmerus mordax]|uniref:death domain-containing protein 1 n=1 Tax=Osmerus mordax TaxID=8014 RepID=UPI00350FB8EC